MFRWRKSCKQWIQKYLDNIPNGASTFPTSNLLLKIRYFAYTQIFTWNSYLTDFRIVWTELYILLLNRKSNLKIRVFIASNYVITDLFYWLASHDLEFYYYSSTIEFRRNLHFAKKRAGFGVSFFVSLERWVSNPLIYSFWTIYGKYIIVKKITFQTFQSLTSVIMDQKFWDKIH